MTRTTSPVIETSGITQVFGASTVLDSVDLAVSPGEVVVVAGPNGCGKSTLLSIAGGLRRPTRGTALIQGRPAHRMLGRLAVHPETPNVFPGLTGRDNLTCLAGRVRPDDLEEQVAAFRLDDRLLRLKGKAMSYGQRRRILLAAAFARPVGAIIMDEPTGGLDATSVDDVVRAVGVARTRGTGLLITGQDLAVLGDLADTVVALERGRASLLTDWGRVKAAQEMRLQIRAADDATVERLRALITDVGLVPSVVGRRVTVVGDTSRLTHLLGRTTDRRAFDLDGVDLAPLGLAEFTS